MPRPRFSSPLARRFLGVAFALALVAALAGPASAARPRILQPGNPNPPIQNVPATPEPGAALVFGLGVAVVAWASRRHRR
jgi:hypothetical protein